MDFAYGLLVLIGLVGAAILVLAVPVLIGFMIYGTVTGSRELAAAEQSETAEKAAPAPELQELSVA